MLGQAIILNGTSSAGKTTLARALQQSLPGFWLVISFDDFLTSAPPPDLDKALVPPPPEVIQRMIVGFHRSVGAFVQAGNAVIVDHLLLKQEWATELLTALEGAEILRVGVMCQLEELERREQARGDRDVGLARSQVDLVHAHLSYDLELDTSRQSITECVRAVRRLPDWVD